MAKAAKKNVAATAVLDKSNRYAELKTMLDERRRVILQEVQGRIRGVRAEGADRPHDSADPGETAEVDIQTEKGATVKAADGGTVVYAGNEVRNMGNLVLVSHNGGWITAYANNESLLVKKGDAVKKGQAIAKADAKVHFDVRRANKTLDPMTVLPAQ